MKVFLDANVLVATLNREYPLYTWSSRILSLQGKNNISIFTSPLCLAIAFYFASKKSGEVVAKRKIDLLCRNIEITSIDESTAQKAISNAKINDFEDGLEYYSALSHGCEWIITEDRDDFWFSELKVAGCEEFLKMIKRGNIFPA
jgi:predicted nucleic acid-binding protein